MLLQPFFPARRASLRAFSSFLFYCEGQATPLFHEGQERQILFIYRAEEENGRQIKQNGKCHCQDSCKIASERCRKEAIAEGRAKDTEEGSKEGAQKDLFHRKGDA